MSAEEHRKLVERATAASRAGAERAACDPHRLAYHFMPPGGWMNDPNGLIQWRGDYHLFYQHNPCAPDWGAMHWGHAISEDLVHWEHLPVALAPSEPYDRPPEGGGCFSGSAVDDDGTLTLVYTGTSDRGEANQKQCIATGTDGVHFTKFAGNPVIPAPPPEGAPDDFRDPKVWRRGGWWHMVVGSTRDGRGNVLLFRSRDLREWEYRGVAAASAGDLGRMWECPDLFPLGDRHLLVISPIGVERRKSVTLVGEFDHQAGRFARDRILDTDYGPGFYAPQSFLDDRGRRIMFGWMIAGGECPNVDYGWNGAQTLPRLVRMLPDGAVGFSPVPELQTLREERVHEGSGDPDDVRGDRLELIATFRAEGECGLAVRCSPDGRQETRIVCDPAGGTVALELDDSGPAAGGRFTAPLATSPERTVTLHVFIDRSSVEAFTTEARSVLTARIFPDPASDRVRLLGPESLLSLDAWRLASAW